jgi:hypothetical protein
MQKELATVVIPIHLKEPSELEKVSLSQTLAVLHKHPITFMAPLALDTSWYEDYCRGKATIHIERFDWKGFEAFSVLLTNRVFYQRFLHYEYMLICHLDAFVFRDELEKWCSLGYDYIGAVIYSDSWVAGLDSLARRLTGFRIPEYFGNGGFALKKVSSFYRITSRFKLYLDVYHWLRRLRKVGFLNDIFIAQHFPKLSSSFRIPPKSVAQRFGAEYVKWPEQELPFTNRNIQSLPFGIHGWIQFHPEYWKPCIRQLGYSV